MAANDFDPEDEDELQQKAKGIIIRPTVPIPVPRPAAAPLVPMPMAPPLEPSQTAPETFAGRYAAVGQSRPMFGSSFDPTPEEVRAEKHFDPNTEAWQDVEDRRREEGMRTAAGKLLPATSLQEVGYQRHPELRPEPAIQTPSLHEPSTPMGQALGREDIYGTKPGSQVGDFAPGRDTQEQYKRAVKELNLTDQEKALYQRHLNNLWGPGGVDHPNGARSTLFQTTVGVGDKTYNIPTVWGGKIVEPMEAFKRAQAEGLEKFPSYHSPEEAMARYDKMHEYMDRDVGQYKRLGSPWSK